LTSACSAAAQNTPGATSSSSSTFVIAADTLVDNMDPAAASSQPELQFAKAVYETLVNYDVTSKKLTAGLATSWQMSADSKTLTLHLRQGVTFHDGGKLTGDGVVASLKRTIAIGKGESSLLSDVDTMTAPDQQTVVITLKSPDPGFLDGLQRQFIVSPTAIAQHAGTDQGQSWFSTHEAGSGPYELKSFEPNQKVVYDQFSGYWQGWSGKHIQEYVVNSVPDAATQLLQVKQGTADWATAISTDDANTLRTNSSVQVKVYQGSPFYLMFNTGDGKLNDPQVRQAISLAVDPAAINTQIMHGMASPLRGPLPDWMAGQDSSAPVPTQNLDQAKSLLAAAGYSASKPLKLSFLYFNGWSWEQTVATILQADLKQIGVTLDVKSAPWASFTQQVGNKATRPDMGSVAVYVPTPSPDPVLTASFDPASEGNWAYWGYNNPTFTSALRTAEATSNATQQAALFNAAQQVLIRDYAAIWLMDMPDIFVLRKDVQGWTHDPSWGLIPDYYHVYKA
jgi:peptide/nickel transport system substrate-binding protein